MKANTDQVLAAIGLSEGGRVDDSRDPGGRTNRGITQRTFDAWRAGRGEPKADVWSITKAEAEAIIVAQYLAPVRFDDLPAGLDYAVADYAVNSGPARAVKDLQAAAGMPEGARDGVMGSQTLAAVAAKPAADLIRAYCDRRLAFLKSLKTWSTFGKGWGARVASVQTGALKMAAGAALATVLLLPEAPAKAVEADRRQSDVLAKVLKDPVATVAALSPLATPLVNSQPIQIAMAVVIVLLAGWALMRALRREA